MASRLNIMNRIAILLFVASLLPCCCPSPSSQNCKEMTGSDFKPVMHIVMVHGFLERGNNFKMLSKRLEKHQIGCHVMRLKPSDGRTGLDALALQLKEQIESELGQDKKFSIVSYSMGGLISRYYLQNLDGASRCQQLITVSTPHHGTWTAKFYPGKGARQMRRGSEFLKALEQTSDQLGEMPITSYRTPMDLIILPTTSSIWKRAENRKYYALLHPLMLNIPSVLSDIERRLVARSCSRPKLSAP